MHRLRLKGVAVADVAGLLDLEVAADAVTAIIVPAPRIRALSDVLVGLEAPAFGRIEINGHPPAQAHRMHRGIRLVPSDGGLLPNLTVLDNVLYTECVVQRRPRAFPEMEVRNVTALAYDLNDVLDRYPHEITIGRRRLAGLARAMRARPSIVVLEDDADAPTWPALLGIAQQDGESDSGQTHFGVTGMLDGAAAVVVTSDKTRVQGLDQPPAEFHTDTVAGGPASGRDSDA